MREKLDPSRKRYQYTISHCEKYSSNNFFFLEKRDLLSNLHDNSKLVFLTEQA